MEKKATSYIQQMSFLKLLLLLVFLIIFTAVFTYILGPVFIPIMVTAIFAIFLIYSGTANRMPPYQSAGFLLIVFVLSFFLQRLSILSMSAFGDSGIESLFLDVNHLLIITAVAILLLVFGFYTKYSGTTIKKKR